MGLIGGETSYVLVVPPLADSAVSETIEDHLTCMSARQAAFYQPAIYFIEGHSSPDHEAANRIELVANLLTLETPANGGARLREPRHANDHHRVDGRKLDGRSTPPFHGMAHLNNLKSKLSST